MPINRHREKYLSGGNYTMTGAEAALYAGIQAKTMLEIQFKQINPTVSDTAYLKAYYSAMDSWNDMQSKILLEEN